MSQQGLYPVVSSHVPLKEQDLVGPSAVRTTSLQCGEAPYLGDSDLAVDGRLCFEP